MSMMLCLVAVLEFSVVPVSKVLVSSQSTQVSCVTTGLCIGEACSSSMLPAIWPMPGCIQILISFVRPGDDNALFSCFVTEWMFRQYCRLVYSAISNVARIDANNFITTIVPWLHSRSVVICSMNQQISENRREKRGSVLACDAARRYLF
jgi:hypothetical protein